MFHIDIDGLAMIKEKQVTCEKEGLFRLFTKILIALQFLKWNEIDIGDVIASHLNMDVDRLI